STLQAASDGPVSGTMQEGLFRLLRLLGSALLVEGLQRLLLRVLLLIHTLAHDDAPVCSLFSSSFNAAGSTGFESQPMNPAARVSSAVPYTGSSAIARRGTCRMELDRCDRNRCAS